MPVKDFEPWDKDRDNPFHDRKDLHNLHTPDPPRFIIKDSGKREEFKGGMVRDTQENKVDWWRILIGPMMERYAIHLTKGNQKYPDVNPGIPNWTMAAGVEERERFKQSAMRHFVQWMRGDQDEDHAAAIFFNVNGHEYVKEKLEPK